MCMPGQRGSIPWLSTQEHGGRTEEVMVLGEGGILEDRLSRLASSRAVPPERDASLRSALTVK